MFTPRSHALIISDSPTPTIRNASGLKQRLRSGTVNLFLLPALFPAVSCSVYPTVLEAREDGSGRPASPPEFTIRGHTGPRDATVQRVSGSGAGRAASALTRTWEEEAIGRSKRVAAKATVLN